ncbi:MAG: glycoside hydrolase, partial [Mycolicibacterium sp.]
MPSALVTTLSAPIRRVQALVGPGWAAGPAAEPGVVLAGVRAMLSDVAQSVAAAWQRTGAGWSGAGADAAADFASRTVAAIDDAAERAGRLGAAAENAAAAVARARRRLQAIVDEFEARAAALEPRLDSPGVAAQLLAEARDALGQAIAVVEELLAELDGHAAALDAPAGTAPAGAVPPSPGGSGQAPPASAGVPGSGGFPGWSGSSGGLGTPADLAGFTRPDPAETPDAATFGE